MTHDMTDDGRAVAAQAFDGLDARAAQEALEDALHMTHTDEVPDAEDEVRAAAERARQARLIEGLLFASPEALDEAAIAERLPAGADVAGVLEALKLHYENRGVQLAKVAGRWRFQTAPDVAPILETRRVEPRKLSRAALETLAIIAYHQPCTRAEIEDIRGVVVSKGSLDQLLEIGWVRLKGRKRDSPGRPVLFATTPAFLEHFGLETVTDLPGLADLKAAGLLDARLPPGFAVPTPADAGDDDGADDDETSESAEFSQDFLGEEPSHSSKD
jgi:segregation and condensation protein B